MCITKQSAFCRLAEKPLFFPGGLVIVLVVPGVGEGRNLGKAAAVMALLEELGALPEELAVRIENESDPEILDRWVRLAAKADSLEMFRENM